MLNFSDILSFQVHKCCVMCQDVLSVGNSVGTEDRLLLPVPKMEEKL